MSFTNFYMDTGGHNMAAGSVQNAAASVTSTNGAWSTVTNIFTPNGGGTPFSGVSAGEYASIYVDGVTTGAVFVGKIATVNGGGATITIDATIRYGTPPTTNGTLRSCKVGGSWLSELPLTTLTGNVPQATKVNCNNALTISANRTFSLAGLTTAPIWYDGYNTNPGDLDTDTTNTLAKPVWTCNSGVGITANVSYQLWSNISVTGTRTSALWTAQGTPSQYVRMRFDNTNSSVNTFAFNFAAASVSAYYCYFKAPVTATTSGTVSIGNSSVWLVGCVAEGGGLGCYSLSTTSPTFINCVAINGGASGWAATTGAVRLFGCTASNMVADGVKWTGTPNSVSVIVGCLFRTCVNGIDNASGTNTNNVVTACNDFYDCTATVGLGDTVNYFGQTDSADPVISASNMTPISTSNAWAHGFPGIFENQTYSSFASIGAVMPAAGYLFIPVE